VIRGSARHQFGNSMGGTMSERSNATELSDLAPTTWIAEDQQCSEDFESVSPY
jgi:hypothetical protein